MKAFIIVLFSITLFFFIDGCGRFDLLSGRVEADSTETRVIALNGQTALTVENTNGNIDISSSDTAKSIYCTITKKVKSRKNKKDAQLHLKSININITKSSDNVKIKVDHPKNDNRSYAIDFEIILPDNFNYNLSLGNGNVSVNSATKNLAVDIGNGEADADVVLKDGCNVSMSTGNGAVSLKIPNKTDATVNANVGNGIINNSGLVFENMEKSSRTLSGTLGSGAGSIDLSVGNGTISLRKK